MDSTFFNQKDLESYKDDFLLQTLSLAVFFVFITMLYSMYRFYKKSYEKNVKNVKKEIKNVNDKFISSLTYDLLTNLSNKKYFLERLDEEFKRAMRDKNTISLLIVNIDEFRAFRDIYGKNDGDECLKLIAKILTKHCNRASDLVARIDKDEFAIILPNTNEPKIVSQKCVDDVQKMQIIHENSIASNVVTISIGTSSLDATNIEQKDDLISNAQTSLETAKKSGRNRVV